MAVGWFPQHATPLVRSLGHGLRGICLRISIKQPENGNKPARKDNKNVSAAEAPATKCLRLALLEVVA